MREIRIEKITLNIGVGEPGEKLDKAMKLLNSLSGLKSVKTVTMKKIPTWGIRTGLPIAAKVTIRGKDAEKLLSRLLNAVDNTLNRNKFDEAGNFSFGIDEYIKIPDVEYDHEVGIIGLEVAVTLGRKGYRVKRRRLKKGKIRACHKITKEEGINFIKDKFKIELEEES
jgi:large subunit ribosomal protein L5